ncbi:MAG: disulfide bond formation protein B [Rhodospirillaceae bacterium]|nr:disulfide bond formation protein B [Rhodospirillaceae bacterium]
MNNPDRTPSILIFLGSAALLLGAYGFEYIGGLQPCVLCLYQRLPHAAVLAIALSAILLVSRPVATLFLTGLAGLVLLTSAGIAGYHVGVEQKWWEGPAGCQAPGTAETVAALRAQLLGRPVIRCGEVPWSLFGVSMAGYNMLISTAMGLFALWTTRKITRERPKP